MDTISTVVDMINLIEYYDPHTPIPMPQRSFILPKLLWSIKAIETTLSITLHSDIKQLWNETSGLLLFYDTTYGQWGLIIWSPDQAIIRHQRYITETYAAIHDFQIGDCIIGEFFGDTDLLIVRCDPTKPDFGTVIVTSLIDSRDNWSRVASSLTEFLTKFITHYGQKYWEK